MGIVFMIKFGVVALPVADLIYNAGRAWWLRRRALVDDCLEDLAVLNSKEVLSTPLHDSLPIPTTTRQRGGVWVHDVKSHPLRPALRHHHKLFCARWARAAKVRFHFAQICQDTAVNRAALHRWFVAQWKETYKLESDFHRLDCFLADSLDMAFLPTDELVKSESKRAFRRQARAERHQERLFVESWK